MTGPATSPAPTAQGGLGPAVVCIGHASLDSIVRVSRLPEPDERLPALDGALAGGGPAATAAVALARLGIPVAFAGRAGDDATGAWVRAGLEAEGVGVADLRVIPGARSPFTVVLVDATGRRSLIPTAGSGHRLDPAAPLADDPAFVARCREAAWLHLDHIGIGELPALRAGGVTTPASFDGGNPVPEVDLRDLALYAPTDAALLARYPGRDLHGALEAALDEGVPLVVATRGADGAIAATREDGRTAVHEVPAPAVEVVSTLGAGDVFHGALLAALVDRQPVPDALRFAVTAAALSCAALDGRSAIPSRAALLAALVPSEVSRAVPG